MSAEPTSLERGSAWSTGTLSEAVTPMRSGLPVRWSASNAMDLQGDLRGGDVDVVAVGDEPGAQAAVGEPEPDAVARGWVVPPGGSRVDAIFVLAGTSLGIGRVERATTPVWLNLDDLVNLDAIGDPVDGLTEVEITMEDQRIIGAGWTDDFCDAVVEVLRASTGRPTATPGSPADTSHLIEARARPTTDDAPEQEEVPPVSDSTFSVAPSVATPAPPMSEPAPTLFAAPPSVAEPVLPESAAESAVPPSAALELEDVVYLGGYPGHSKRRKKCVVGMTRSSLELNGPGDLNFRIGWDVVRSVEVQNSDEARFRMNTKIHRDASALVVECDQGVTILLEARDCPTIALRSAITQLLDGLPVVVA